MGSETDIIYNSSRYNFSFCHFVLLIILAILLCKLLNKFNIIESFTSNNDNNTTFISDKCVISTAATARPPLNLINNGYTKKDYDIHQNIINGNLCATGGMTYGGNIACPCPNNQHSV